MATAPRVRYNVRNSRGPAMDDDVVPRYLVLVDGYNFGREHESEERAIESAERCKEGMIAGAFRTRSVEVVRSVRRWELDADTGDMLEVGEKLKEQPA